MAQEVLERMLDLEPLATTMNAPVPSYEDVTPEDIAAIEKVLQHIDHQNAKKAVLAPLANWILALKIYKDVEVRYTCMKDRTKLTQPHRAMLSSIMALGECMVVASEALSDSDLKSIHISHAALAANVKYLRMKYSQWYGTRDPNHLAEVNEAVETAVKGDERKRTA